MKIKLLTVSSKGLDTPIRFPAPCQPALKTAGDLRIKTEENEDKHEVVIEDAKKAVNFGGRLL